MKKTTNTSKEKHLDWIFGGNPNAIERQEAEGQKELVASSQLPKKCNSPHGTNAAEQYRKMGIEVFTGSKDDDLFMGVKLPAGWKKEGTDHSMWNNLLDGKGRIRATFFYKAAFYDRSAFINFEQRYNYNLISFLPEEEKGHFEEEEITVRNPRYDRETQIYGGWGNYSLERQFITEKHKVWVPKYQDNYEEYNNTPHYLEVTDCGTVIFTTKDSPLYYREKYGSIEHRQWWDEYEKIDKSLSEQANKWLTEHYPDWQDINAYWD